jgi:parvulin-like peptidyl-prolyl isomerase
MPIIVFALLVLVAAAVLFSALPARGQEAVEVNRLILRVNDQILTLHDYETLKAQEVSRILANPNLTPGVRQEQMAELGKQLVKTSFDEMLLLSRAKQLSIIVTQEQIDSTILQIREEQGLASDEAFRNALTSFGMTLEQLRDDYRREITMREIVSREIQDRIDLSEDALRAFYRENEDRFSVPERRRIEEVIVLSSSGLDDNQLRKVAADVLAAAASGVSLTEASASFREQDLVSEVVDLGWLQSEELGADLRAAAFSTTVGTYSEPIEARGGLHLLHVFESEPGGKQPFSEVQGEVRQRLRNQSFGREMRSYMAELEARAFVREDLPPEAVGFRALAGTVESEADALDLLHAPELPTPEVEEVEKGDEGA